MLIRNNKGEVVGEMNMSITEDGTVINTDTLYNDGRPVTQNISIRDSQGKVRTTNVIGGKILPSNRGFWFLTGAQLPLRDREYEPSSRLARSAPKG